VFVDESGADWPRNPEKGARARRQHPGFFVLAAVGMPAQRWQEVEAQIEQLKRQWVPFLEPNLFEIKGRDLQQGTGPFRHLKWDQRMAIFQTFGDLLLEWRTRIWAVEIDKEWLYKEPAIENLSTDDLYQLALPRLLEQIAQTLQTEEEYGTLRMDARSTLHSSVQDRRFLDMFQRWQQRHPLLGRRFLEPPWFGFSAFYVGLQIADVVAYLIHRAALEAKRERLAFATQIAQNWNVQYERIPPFALNKQEATD